MTTFLRIDPVMLLEIGNEFKAGYGCFQHTDLHFISDHPSQRRAMFECCTRNQARCRSWALLVTRRIEGGGVENA